MKITTHSSIALFLTFLLAGCGSGGGGGGSGSSTTGGHSIVYSASRAAPLNVCPNGGISVDAGIDRNDNGILDASEVTSTQQVCNGTNGTNGTSGTNGTNGTNGADGTNGAVGTNGFAAGVKLSDEPSGANCPYGGTKIEVGPDANSDGLPDTVTSTNYICNAGDANATTSVAASIDSVNVVSGSGNVTLIISFTVKNAAGNEIVGLGDADMQDGTKLAHLAFNIAKLLPGSNGDTNSWLTVTSEATLSKLSNKGGGHYTYTTDAISTSGATSSAKYDNTQLTRVLLRVMPNNSATQDYSMGHLATLDSGANAFYDISNGSTASKDVVRTANCLECHSKFGGSNSFHVGEGNVATEACAVCHIPNSGTPSGDGEVGRLVHKIHTSQIADGRDFTDVKYPQDIRNCTKCHKGGADSDNWKTRPTMAICSSCHPVVNFTIGTNHPTGGPQADNSRCAGSGCHTPANIVATHTPVVLPDPAAWVSNMNTNAAYLAAAGALPAGAHRITYVVESVWATPDSSSIKRPSIRFKLKDDGTDVVFASYAAGITDDPMPGFVGSPGVYFAWAVPQDGIATPADFNATASGYIKSIWNGTATGTGSGTLSSPDASGFYTITLTGVRVPDNAVMLTGGVGYTLSLSTAQPLTQKDLTAYPYDVTTKVGGLIVPALNVWKVGTGFTGRRVVVSTDKCNACHDGLGVAPNFHVGQRNDATTCSFCHNPNMTSSGWSENAGSMIHGIHAVSKRAVPYTWRATSYSSGNRYPGVLKNCEQCHVPGGYDYSGNMYTGAQSVSNMLMTTSAAGIYSTTPYANSTYFTISPYVVADGVANYGNKFSNNAATSVTVEAAASTLVQSPVTAVCVSCHDSAIARNHMIGNGGSFYIVRSTALLNQSEQCLMCHGPGRIASIKEVHSR